MTLDQAGKPWRTWKDWFKSDDASEVKQLLKGYATFELPALGKATKDECTRLLGYCNKCKPGSKTSEAGLQEQLGSMTLVELRSYIDSEKRTAEDGRHQLGQRRKSGWRKGTTAIQDFFLTFDRFLCAYSGVVDLVSHADDSYGNVATATLSVMFVTIKNKAAGEVAIQSAMQQITDRLPDMDIYQSVYADARLGECLSKAYIKVICFARTTIEYFEGSGVGRVVRSLGKPREFEAMDDDMRQCFNNVRNTTDALLAQRVSELDKTNKELLEKLEQFAGRHDHEIVLSIHDSMGITLESKQDHNKSLVKYQDDLALQFSLNDDFARLSLAELQQTTEYTKWMNADSCMLVLSGRNHHGLNTVSESWLSEPTLKLISNLKFTPSTEGPAPELAYHICLFTHKHLDILSNIISQLLGDNPKVVRRPSGFQDIRSSINKFSPGRAGSYPDSDSLGSPSLTPQSTPKLGRTGSYTSGATPVTPTRGGEHRRLRDEFAHRGAALLKIIARISAPVYIIIDRPEVCDDQNRKTTKLFLETLVMLVSNVGNLANDDKGTKRIVKVMVVIKDDFWDLSEFTSIDELDELEDIGGKKALEKSGQLVLCRKDQGLEMY